MSRRCSPLLLYWLLLFSHSLWSLYNCIPCKRPISLHAEMEWLMFSSHIFTWSWVNCSTGASWCPMSQSPSRIYRSFHYSHSHQWDTSSLYRVLPLHSRTAEAEQLAKSSLFPASFERPETMFTFNVLKQFHILGSTAKIPAYDFFNTLVNMTDNAFPKNVPISNSSTWY